MEAPVDPHYLTCSAELCEAVMSLRGRALVQQLSSIARILLESPEGGYFQGGVPDKQDLSQEITSDGECYGQYAVSGRVGGYDYLDRMRLAALARLTASLLQARVNTDRRAREFAFASEKLRQQSQIIEQIHESVITMDMTGFITSWNKGAEQLFGYTALEAIGANILFLYADENVNEEMPLHDAFLEQGGREMEVRRRKKSGEIFWASLSLSPLKDDVGRPIGLIGYITDITQRKDAEERIHHLAYHDMLTGLPNRSLMVRLVDQALLSMRRNALQGAILFIDLNRFKPINDTLGHAVGDALLQQVAHRFRTVLRNEDVVARLGGDEFAVALFDIDQHYQAGFVAQKILASLEPPFLLSGHQLRIGASVGISVFPQDGPDSETLLRLADIAMYRAKKDDEGDEGCYAFYSEEMNQRVLNRLLIENGLRHALDNNELLLHYQPKINLANNRIIGAEALVRWQHPEHGMIPPGDFIPVAEETRLVTQVGEWVLEAACKQASIWLQAGFSPIRIAVNVSAREFTQALPGRVLAALERHALTPDWLELEITESMLMHSAEHVISIMENITAFGVPLSLDDFGTGYSSLSYLKRFPIDTLKIDRSFTMGIPHDMSDCAIAGAIISIAKQLQHKVIAEGVENMEQLAFLMQAGCDEVQGYLFSAPIPANHFEAMLIKNRNLNGE